MTRARTRATILTVRPRTGIPDVTNGALPGQTTREVSFDFEEVFKLILLRLASAIWTVPECGFIFEGHLSGNSMNDLLLCSIESSMNWGTLVME